MYYGILLLPCGSPVEGGRNGWPDCLSMLGSVPTNWLCWLLPDLLITISIQSRWRSISLMYI